MNIQLHSDLPPIQIKYHAQAKRMKLKIMAHQIVLTCPPRISILKIKQFLQQQQTWLLEHWQAPTLNHQWQLFDYTQKTRHTVQLSALPEDDKKLYLYQPYCQLYFQASQREIALKKFLLSYAKQHLPSYLHDIAQEMNLHYQKISIRHAQTRWGSCNHQQAIMLNAYLVCCPIHLIRYVCIHELAHTVHFNHSAQFWQLVAQYDPHYQQHQAELRQILIQF